MKVVLNKSRSAYFKMLKKSHIRGLINWVNIVKDVKKPMNNSELTHCSDECLFASIIDSISINKKNEFSL